MSYLGTAILIGSLLLLQVLVQVLKIGGWMVGIAALCVAVALALPHIDSEVLQGILGMALGVGFFGVVIWVYMLLLDGIIWLFKWIGQRIGL